MRLSGFEGRTGGAELITSINRWLGVAAILRALAKAKLTFPRSLNPSPIFVLRNKRHCKSFGRGPLWLQSEGETDKLHQPLRSLADPRVKRRSTLIS